MPLEPPRLVWVYWCRNCGQVILADLKRVPTTTCPYCPYPKDRNVAVDRYQLARGKGGKGTC